MDGSLVRSDATRAKARGVALPHHSPAGSARTSLVAEHDWIPDDELPALRRHFLKRARQVRTYQPAYASALFRVATDYGRVVRARRNP